MQRRPYIYIYIYGFLVILVLIGLGSGQSLRQVSLKPRLDPDLLRLLF